MVENDTDAVYFCEELNLNATEGQGLTLHLCLHDLLSAANHMNCVSFVLSFSRFDNIHLSSSSMHAI